MNTDLKHSQITENIIGASFEVHSFLGNGFQEVIYQRALAYEMSEKKPDFERELEVGLLINFGSKSLTFKRLALSKNNR
ncbi:GxxExxY protein [Rhodohalobacter sulfatireducens]|uniref:GxxExxY protein n=1 Tax=Rhodohalobacter sulfatireducens TaxID=2911366 RepID=A0ABS9KGI1_9BACT|nr:GxxExxY protein [Rhodohalobacter sulfatireducens]MCG2589969.1 GxxExxY protein [Rhodohalobacter sulfatireducens]